MVAVTKTQTEITTNESKSIGTFEIGTYDGKKVEVFLKQRDEWVRIESDLKRFQHILEGNMISIEDHYQIRRRIYFQILDEICSKKTKERLLE